MKRIGFVDYYISEWHANNYPAWIDDAGSDYKVTHVWAELDTSPLDGVTTDEWCAKFGIKKCATIDELCTECDAIIILAPSNPEKHLPYAKAVFKYGKLIYEKVTSEFFRKLLCDIVRFFDEKTVSFDITQTLEVIRIRDELLQK